MPVNAEGATSMFDPAGPGAAMVADLGWLLFVVAVVVYLFTMGLLLYALFRKRDTVPALEAHSRRTTSLVLLGGVGMPVVILTPIFLLTLTVSRTLSLPLESDAMVIEVTGHQWWWEVRYPEQEFVTANEIHIPVNHKVRIDLKSADVIHSFWVPELQGKIDLVNGQTNHLWLQADEPGVYAGICAEFCGLQHARMLFRVVAQPEDAFAAWLQQQSQPAADPANEEAQRGQAVFIAAGCGNCHTIEGTGAQGKLGPDLTHFASRLTIGAGALPNVRGHLGGWVVDSQSIKPGNFMPPVNLSAEDLQVILAYLESLE